MHCRRRRCDRRLCACPVEDQGPAKADRLVAQPGCDAFNHKQRRWKARRRLCCVRAAEGDTRPILCSTLPSRPSHAATVSLSFIVVAVHYAIYLFNLPLLSLPLLLSSRPPKSTYSSTTRHRRSSCRMRTDPRRPSSSPNGGFASVRFFSLPLRSAAAAIVRSV
jgi:hypothetical protein